jgi:MioC protein
VIYIAYYDVLIMDHIAGDAEMSTLRVGIFVATMTGLAELCAEEIQGTLSARGFDCTTVPMDHAVADALDPLDVIVVVSSTYGHGDIPDNGQAFFASLQAHPGLSGKRFAIFALGDRTYADTFCHAGEKWDALLDAKGAQRIAALERHDACAGTLAEDEAGAWAASWIHCLSRAA